MIADLERLEPLGLELGRRARALGALLIWRAQARSARRVVVRRGKTESSSVASSSGAGIQVADPGGHAALGSRDDFLPEPAFKLLERLVGIARAGDSLGLARNALPELSPLQAVEVPGHHAEFDRVELAATARRLAEIEAELVGRVPGVNQQVSFRADLDAWRIMRSDGTDVLFAMPRCVLALRATGAGAGDRHGVSVAAFSPRPDLLDDDHAMGPFLRQAEAAARLALELPNAPTHPAGSFPLVIDYALAKGLAHEAFGHASEADGFRSSVLAREGRFRRGERVAGDAVSIVDEPIEGDHAWQPFSANGLPRSRAVLVDRGRLSDGLSDPWSAAAGGVRLTGAARAESFRHAPQPRMTNIRIEVADPLPAPGGFEEYGPAEVRDLLAGAGVFRRHRRVAFLSGYTGGQVNTATGDFAFHCKAIYDLGPDRIALHKPAMFAGSMFGALQSIREAFGPLRLDAIGYCGKWGQHVPSSGGSHYFLVLDPHPDVRLGGR